MKAPISWLKEYVDINVDIITLCERMVAIGFEIEEVINLADSVTNIVIGNVLTVSQHPNADKLHCLTIDIGERVIPIVTNDQNVIVGHKVPVALDKAKIADGTIIKSGKIRGELSEGMLCGFDELGINSAMYHSETKDGVLILRDTAKVGTNIIYEVGLDDCILDISVTSNRQDCNSIYGLAREVGVALEQPIRPLAVDYTTIPTATGNYVAVRVEDLQLCPNYYMQGIVDVEIGQSPQWMTSRLSKCGHNAINNIVDITNYCLLEVGQPMHAFDYRQLSDQQIIVRRAQDGESLVALDNKQYNLNNSHLVIADNTCPIGLAGIMGGKDSGIQQDTTIVMLECARFARESIRRSSRGLSLRSESSARFEKGIDNYTTQIALSRALHLVSKLGCGKILSDRIDATGTHAQPQIITFETSRIKQILGIDIDQSTVIKILASLQFEATINNGVISCIVPPYRDDCVRDCDIVEEIIRVYGYDNIRGTLMSDSHITHGGKSARAQQIDSLKSALIANKYNESIFYPFAGKLLYDKLSIDKQCDVTNNIRLINPLGEELSLMNTTLVANMLQCVANNHARKNTAVRLFECGKVYLADKLPLQQLPMENNRLCISNSCIDFLSFQQDILNIVDLTNATCKFVRSSCSYLHPGVSADIVINGVVVGCFGKVHPVIADNFDLQAPTMLADIDLDKLYEFATKKFVFVPMAKYQAVKRDIAVVVSEDINAQDMVDSITNASKLCVDVSVFDVFRSKQLGDNVKSVALSVTLQASDRTLSDADIDKTMTRIINILNQAHGAKLR